MFLITSLEWQLVKTENFVSLLRNLMEIFLKNTSKKILEDCRLVASSPSNFEKVNFFEIIILLKVHLYHFLSLK